MTKINQISLSLLKAEVVPFPLRAAWAGKMVRIWSEEHGAYWRPSGGGYTVRVPEIGVFPFEMAWTITRHAGPEKGIWFEEA